MGRGDRRKCKCCLKLFCPDPHNRRHQHYCSASACRAASKAASQARWLAKPESQSYFRGPVNGLDLEEPDCPGEYGLAAVFIRAAPKRMKDDV
jgi:hypothetical protein